MSMLYLAWRQPDRQWWPIGCLERREDGYTFRYTRGAELAERQAGFGPLPSFPELGATYVSKELFPVFQNRLIREQRPDFASFVRWMDLPPGETDPLQLLARSGGRRATDMFEVFAPPKPDPQGQYRMVFFVHGLRHRPETERAAADGLRPGDGLRLDPDPQNPVHDQALRVLTAQEGLHIGYVPRYLCADLLRVARDADARVTVRRVNPSPAPMQFRVLASFGANWPAGFEPFSSEDFDVLAPRATTQVA